MSNFQVSINAEQHFLIDGVQINGFAETELASGATAFYNGGSLWIIPEGAKEPGSSVFLEDFAFGGDTGGWIDVQMRALEDGGFVLAGAVNLGAPGRVQVFNSDGSARSDAFDLPGPLEEVEAMSSGGFAITYIEYGGAQPALRMRGFSADGVAAGTPTTVTSHAQWVDDLGSSLIQLSNGQFVVEWRFRDAARQYRIVNPDGSLASEIMDASDAYGGLGEIGENLEHSHILERPEGGFAIFWTDPSSFVHGQLFATDGEPEGPSFLAAPRVGHSKHYSVDITYQGLFLIVAGRADPILHVLGPDGNALLLNYALPNEIEIGRIRGFSEADGMPTLYLSGPTQYPVPNTSLGESFITIDVNAGYVVGDDDDTVAMRDVWRVLDAGAGDDAITGTMGADEISGGLGHDQLIGNLGADWLSGGDGDDLIFGGDLDSALRQDRSDTIFGGAGNDTIFAGHGNDSVWGMDDSDVISGGFGADFLAGQNGDDSLTGSAFADQLFGNAGDDFLNGGFGHDLVNGGAGADRFYHIGVFDHGSDWIQDYDAAEGDILWFGNDDATVGQFQINTAHTSTAAGQRSGEDDVEEAFVIYRPTDQILWALVDGGAQSSINLQIGENVFDLLV
ncbi:calcium-binding protein [Shimia thalassica]|uniref:calcium-binding protein n=1 Tax=Shimia thalassica TaxID=1715693 RepID=UPI002734B86D|nr:calcium-binding protein [Shimia thalassica]MDP2520782.1 calcium-binding protein [Shimia thalassica]